MKIRERRIVRMALLYLQSWWGEAAEYFADESQEYPQDFPFVESDIKQVSVGSEIFFVPNEKEMDIILDTEAKSEGNWRTAQLLTLALHFALERLDDLGEDFAYNGDSERIADADTHFTVEDISFAKPTQEELSALIDSVREIVKYYPAVADSPHQAWDVYDYVEGHWEQIDTVFYIPSCDRTYVRNGLINHDGYNPNIVVMPG